jgi:hypothetical protein
MENRKIIKDTRDAQGNGWQACDFNGWQQAREFVNGKPGRWRFYIAGFSDHDCRVLRADGSYSRVEIDRCNRINIDGKQYGQAHWNH